MTPQRRAIYNKIKGRLNNDLYKAVRLSIIHPNGERDILIGFNRFDPGKGLERFIHLQEKIENDLEPGRYLIECKTGASATSTIDKFEIIIKSKLALPPTTGEESHTKETIHHPEVETMSEIDLDDYKKLVDENADLRAQIKILTFQINWQETNKPLGDAPEKKSMVTEIFSALSEQAPSILGAWDAYMTTKNRELDIKERQLSSSGKSNNSYKVKSKKPTRAEVLQNMIKLERTNPSDFDSTLDEMEVQDPELFNYIVKEMGLEFEEEEEEEEQEEEDQQ